jgi:hypothetical protein
LPRADFPRLKRKGSSFKKHQQRLAKYQRRKSRKVKLGRLQKTEFKAR